MAPRCGLVWYGRRPARRAVRQGLLGHCWLRGRRWCCAADGAQELLGGAAHADGAEDPAGVRRLVLANSRGKSRKAWGYLRTPRAVEFDSVGVEFCIFWDSFRRSELGSFNAAVIIGVWGFQSFANLHIRRNLEIGLGI
ncbi:hypothetical protein Taro_000666 [Colocasia esculenta]|uniref:Uncharacterized protein n=1 Tax=Colocasia esculenta TaxID=4460 RepID=A0A843TFL1_COLES|nr:hypothetical protein [Colocasia esculenta]